MTTPGVVLTNANSIMPDVMTVGQQGPLKNRDERGPGEFPSSERAV